MIRLMMGEASVLVLGGQRALPKRLEAAGFAFRWYDLEEALRMWWDEYVTFVRHVPMKWRNGNHYHTPGFTSPLSSNPLTGPSSARCGKIAISCVTWPPSRRKKRPRRVFAARLTAAHVFDSF